MQAFDSSTDAHALVLASLRKMNDYGTPPTGSPNPAVTQQRVWRDLDMAEDRPNRRQRPEWYGVFGTLGGAPEFDPLSGTRLAAGCKAGKPAGSA